MRVALWFLAVWAGVVSAAEDAACREGVAQLYSTKGFAESSNAFFSSFSVHVVASDDPCPGRRLAEEAEETGTGLRGAGRDELGELVVDGGGREGRFTAWAKGALDSLGWAASATCGESADQEFHGLRAASEAISEGTTRALARAVRILAPSYMEGVSVDLDSSEGGVGREDSATATDVTGRVSARLFGDDSAAERDAMDRQLDGEGNGATNPRMRVTAGRGMAAVGKTPNCNVTSLALAFGFMENRTYYSDCLNAGGGYCTATTGEWVWHTTTPLYYLDEQDSVLSWEGVDTDGNYTRFTASGSIGGCFPLECCDGGCDPHGATLTSRFAAAGIHALDHLCNVTVPERANLFCASAPPSVSITAQCQTLPLWGGIVYIAVVIGMCIIGCACVIGVIRWFCLPRHVEFFLDDARPPFLEDEDSRRAGEERVRRLPIFRFGAGGIAVPKDGSPPHAPGETVMCPITLDDILEGDLVGQFYPCGHTFRAEALRSWLATHSSCPVCRSEWVDPPASAVAGAINATEVEGLLAEAHRRRAEAGASSDDDTALPTTSSSAAAPPARPSRRPWGAAVRSALIPASSTSAGASSEREDATMLASSRAADMDSIELSTTSTTH